MSKTLDELSVVIPVYDEAANIAGLLGEIEARLDGRVRYEVIVVDDGSTDDTLERLQDVRRERRLPLRILHHVRSAGQSAALHNGIAAARCDWIVTLDGDGQNDPADIPKLLAAAAAQGPIQMRGPQPPWVGIVDLLGMLWLKRRAINPSYEEVTE